MSWRDQTIPARLVALEDSEAHQRELRSDEDVDPRLLDMATLAVIGEAMQPLEDLAYLATAWDSPYGGIATYIRATTWRRFTPTNFWQEVATWNDDRLAVFAGFAGRDSRSGKTEHLVEHWDEAGLDFGDGVRDALSAAQDATFTRLRRLLAELGRDWKQFSPFFLAYKHGGLAINRQDVSFVEDDVEAITDETARYHPSIAVWTRARRKQELQADFNVATEKLVSYAASGGRIAVDLCDAFLDSRLASIETLAFSDQGELVGLRPTMQIPWTTWLRRQDLDDQHWAVLGAGPRLTWVSDG